MTTPIYIEYYPKKQEYPQIVFKTLDELSDYLQKRPRLFNADLSQLDLTCPRGQALFNKINGYTDQVIWPAEMAEQMAQQLENGKDSGLGISLLHQKGYTGKGVNVAIIDQALYIDHSEYKDNVVFYKTGIGHGPEEVRNTAQYHGPAVASLLCGKTCGSAPDANLFYYSWFGLDQKTHRQDSNTVLPLLQEIIEWNNTHADKDKIRCLSCSWGDRTDIAFEERQALFKKVEESGCMVFGGFYASTVGRQSCGGFKINPVSDSIENLQVEVPAGIPMETAKKRLPHCVVVPEHNRTFASQVGGYMYEKQGGASWTYPYLAGLVACGLQAFPSYTQQKNWQDKIWQDLLSTGTKDPRNYGAVTVNPVRFIEKMEYYRALENKRLAEHFGNHK